MERTRLIQARMHKHWTQSQVAERLGIDGTTLNRWEKGKATPHAYNVQQLCDVYGVSAYELSLDSESEAREPHPDLHTYDRPGSDDAPACHRLWTTAAVSGHTKQDDHDPRGEHDERGYNQA